jgi:cytoskeletal protein RodZ
MSMNLRPGQELKKIRESKGITLEKAAADTCLRKDLLRQLEDEETVDAMPEIYRRLSLRMYARYLEVPVTQTRTVARESGEVALSPIDGCVELAYSESMRGESEPKKHRTVGPGTVLAVSTLLILTIGLWSLNAKISRLNFDEPREVPVVVEKASLVPPASADPMRLENSVTLTLETQKQAPESPAP